MVTKTGKRHFKCDFRTYLEDGTLAYECLDWTFTTKDANAYMRDLIHAYGIHGIRLEMTNVVDLDAIAE